MRQPERRSRSKQAEADVEACRTEDPKSSSRQEPIPEVVIERVTDADTERTTEEARGEDEDERREAEAAAEELADRQEERTEQEVAVTTRETGAEGMADADMRGVPFADLEGADAYNRAGAEMGDISEVVMEVDSGDLYVVVSAGGFLGLGDTEIVFPYEDVAVIEGRVVIDTTLTEDNITDREDYNETRFTSVPEDRVIR